MKIFYISVLAFAALLIFTACNNKLKIDTSGFNLNEPFPIKIGQTAKMNNGDLKLTLTGIPEDSRCPEDANCIWEGQVRLFLNAATSNNQRSIEFKIEKSKMGRVSQNFEKYTLNVQSVQPLTQSGIRIPKEDYVVTVRVSPKN